MVSDAYSIKDEIIKWRRELHSIPEVGLFLPKTRKYITDALDKMGIKYTLYNNHSGISVVFEGKGDKTVALRADMDALPIEEEIDSSFSSKNKYMHACGHDAHAAILLGTAMMLNSDKYINKLNGNIKLIFQPGEEGPGGALPMIEDGVLKNPDVDAIFALHVGSISGHGNIGEIFIGRGAVFSWDDQLKITFRGKGGHAAKPYECSDLILAACQVVSHINTLISRNVEPWDPVVISITSIRGTSDTYNIMQDKVVIKGTIRTTDIKTRERIFDRIRTISKYISKIHNIADTVEFLDGYPAVVNDDILVEIVEKTAKKMIGDTRVKEVQSPNMGGEDAGFFFQNVPGCYFFLSNSSTVDGICYPHHNSKFSIDDSVLYVGTSVLLGSAMEYLNTI